MKFKPTTPRAFGVSQRGFTLAEALAALDLRIVRSELAFLYAELVGVVMAYGHSARGRLGLRSPLLALVPRTWPARRED